MRPCRSCSIALRAGSQGLQLAGLALQARCGTEEVARFVKSFSCSHRFVLDYLVEEVLAREPPDIQEFLLRSAVLDRLGADICSVVTGHTDAQHVMEYLERGKPVCRSARDTAALVRYHYLFAELLRAKLERGQPELPPVLHATAADWYAAHGLAAEAISRALTGPQSYWYGFRPFLVFVVAQTVFFTWLWNRTAGSLSC